MAGKVIGILQNYAESKDSASNNSDCALSDVSIPFGGELQRTTPGQADLDRMAGRGSDNFIRWCHRCKHEVPEHLEIDVCDLCGGEVVEIER